MYYLNRVTALLFGVLLYINVLHYYLQVYWYTALRYCLTYSWWYCITTPGGTALLRGYLFTAILGTPYYSTLGYCFNTWWLQKKRSVINIFYVFKLGIPRGIVKLVFASLQFNWCVRCSLTLIIKSLFFQVGGEINISFFVFDIN